MCGMTCGISHAAIIGDFPCSTNAIWYSSVGCHSVSAPMEDVPPCFQDYCSLNPLLSIPCNCKAKYNLYISLFPSALDAVCGVGCYFWNILVIAGSFRDSFPRSTTHTIGFTFHCFCCCFFPSLVLRCQISSQGVSFALSLLRVALGFSEFDSFRPSIFVRIFIRVAFPGFLFRCTSSAYCMALSH